MWSNLSLGGLVDAASKIRDGIEAQMDEAMTQGGPNVSGSSGAAHTSNKFGTGEEATDSHEANKAVMGLSGRDGIITAGNRSHGMERCSTLQFKHCAMLVVRLHTMIEYVWEYPSNITVKSIAFHPADNRDLEQSKSQEQSKADKFLQIESVTVSI
ncbi:unnamed protein product [Choristocarpus tenellus]